MTIVCDASVLVKLVLQERASAEARELLKQALFRGEEIYTSDIALAEALNTLWKHATLHRDLGTEEALKAAQDLLATTSRMRLVATTDIALDALRTALQTGITLYDALYAAAAKKLSATLITADEKLAEKASRQIGVLLLK